MSYTGDWFFFTFLAIDSLYTIMYNIKLLCSKTSSQHYLDINFFITMNSSVTSIIKHNTYTILSENLFFLLLFQKNSHAWKITELTVCIQNYHWEDSIHIIQQFPFIRHYTTIRREKWIVQNPFKKNIIM